MTIRKTITFKDTDRATDDLMRDEIRALIETWHKRGISLIDQVDTVLRECAFWMVCNGCKGCALLMAGNFAHMMVEGFADEEKEDEHSTH